MPSTMRGAAGPLLLAVAVALSGCYTEPNCVLLDTFEWDAPGLHAALQDVPEAQPRVAAPGLPAPDGFDAYGGASVASVRFTDPGGALRHATAYLGPPSVDARLVVAVPVDDDTPRPLFDVLWDALGFDDGTDGSDGPDESAKEAAWEEMLAHGGASGLYLTYTADVPAPSPAALDAWLAARGGTENATESTPELGTVHLDWRDWRMELNVPWTTWTLDDEVPQRLQAMPHGPARFQAESILGWTPRHAGEWLVDFLDREDLPGAGADGLEKGPVEELCL